jgi:hypothetical protein
VDGRSLPGARVEIHSVGRGLSSALETDAGGRYRARSLDPGKYRVVASHDGHATDAIDDVDLRLGQELTVDFAMRPAGSVPLEASVQRRPTIALGQATRDVHVSADDIQRTFRTRDFTSLVLRAPGATFEPRAGGISMDGSTAPENRYLIDGVETTGLVFGSSGKPLPPEVVEEVQIKSSGYSAEYGGATGAVVNVVTRSGANRFFGEMGTFYSGSAVDGPARPTLRLKPGDITQAEYVTYPKDQLVTWEPSYLLGGPILVNRLWFFSSYAPSLTRVERTVTFNSNRQQGTFDARAARHASSHNISGLVVNRLRFKAAANLSPTVADNQLPAIDGSSNPNSNFTADLRRPQASYSSSADLVVRPHWLVGVRGGAFISDAHQEGIFQGTRYIFSGSNVGFSEIPADLVRVNGYASAVTNSETTRDRQTRGYLQIDTTIHGERRGAHTLKLGMQWDRISIDRLIGATGNDITLRWNQSLAGARGRYGFYEVTSNEVLPDRGFVSQADGASNNLGFFVQDSWRPMARLTLDVGVRAENERILSFAADPDIARTAIAFSLFDKIAPRIGIAWNPTTDQTTKVYGSWGLFYDVTKLSMPVSYFGASSLTRYYYTLDGFEWPNLDVSGCPPACPGTLLQGPVSFNRPVNDPQSNAIDPALEPMRLQEAVVGIEHALTPRVTLGARYLHRHLDRAVEDIGTLDAQRNEIYTIGNPGFGRAATFVPPGASEPRPLPGAVRRYDAVELNLTKRLADRWSFTGVYRWSRLHGNYSGLTESDRGAVAPNHTRLFDNPVMLFDERGRETLGRLATDRPHTVKAIATCDFAFGTTVSLWTGLASGNPLTRLGYFLPPNIYPVHYLGRGSDGRLPSQPTADLYARHDIRLGQGMTMALDVTVFNLFDFKTVTDRGRGVNQIGSGITLNESHFLNGWDTEQLMAEQRTLRDPRFLMDSAYQSPREVRLGVRLRF